MNSNQYYVKLAMQKRAGGDLIEEYVPIADPNRALKYLRDRDFEKVKQRVVDDLKLELKALKTGDLSLVWDRASMEEKLALPPEQKLLEIKRLITEIQKTKKSSQNLLLSTYLRDYLVYPGNWAETYTVKQLGDIYPSVALLKSKPNWMDSFNFNGQKWTEETGGVRIGKNGRVKGWYFFRIVAT